VYRAHCAVIFAIAQLSCFIFAARSVIGIIMIMMMMIMIMECSYNIVNPLVLRHHWLS